MNLSRLSVWQPHPVSCSILSYFSPQFPHEDVRRAAFGAMGQFCRAQHKVWKENPTEANHQGNTGYQHAELGSSIVCSRFSNKTKADQTSFKQR